MFLNVTKIFIFMIIIIFSIAMIHEIKIMW